MKYGFYILGGVLLGLLGACQRLPFEQEKPPVPGYLQVSAKEAVELPDREYLMRKATMGTRVERVEALDVMERSADISILPFLLERLKKEDDGILRMRVMHVLSKLGDIRAVPPLRKIAVWDDTRVGIEAIVALYELGDDSYVPSLINKLRPTEENPELPGIVHRALKGMTGANLPPTHRAWMSYYRSHRLQPYEITTWFWPFEPPLPPTIAGTTQVVPHPKGQPLLPQTNVRIRGTTVSFKDVWTTEEP